MDTLDEVEVLKLCNQRKRIILAVVTIAAGIACCQPVLFPVDTDTSEVDEAPDSPASDSQESTSPTAPRTFCSSPSLSIARLINGDNTTHNPFAPPSPPSSFLAPSEDLSDSESSVLTSASRGKRKTPTLSDLELNKDPCSSEHFDLSPELSEAQEQWKQLAQDFTQTVLGISKVFESVGAAQNAFNLTVELICADGDLSFDEKMDLHQWFSTPENKDMAPVFTTLPADVRKVWMRRRINKINAAKAR